MQIEVKGLIAAAIAGMAVLGATFGVSAIVVGLQATQDKKASRVTPAASASPISGGYIARGHAFFTQSCISCHGTNGEGAYGPNLHQEKLTDAILTLKIKNGIKGKMPAFSGKYTDDQVQALVAYIRSLT